jgi:hypothetical protein
MQQEHRAAGAGVMIIVTMLSMYEKSHAAS